MACRSVFLIKIGGIASITFPLHAIPDFLLEAFVSSEDRRFYEHHGIDWQALSSALWQNLKSFSRVRGASTITRTSRAHCQ